MAARSEQTTNEDPYNPMLEALIREMIGSTSRPKTSQKAVTDALTEELMTSLLPSSARGTSQTSSFETVLLAEALAPALAEALAPALAEALTPALVKALDNLVSRKKSTQETGTKKASSRQEEE